MFFNFKKKLKRKEGVVLHLYTSKNIEYEILSFIDNQLRIISKEKAGIEFKNKLDYFEQSKIDESFLLDYITNSYEYLEHIKEPEIYSIRRLSDNKVFNLHDKVRFDNGYGPLIRFIVNGSSLYISTGMSGIHLLQEIRTNLTEKVIIE